MQKKTKLLIIGSGPAGYTAAIYASRALLDPILIQGIQPGGQLTITTEVENWPGEKEIQGPDLMTNLEDHAKAAGTNIINNTIMKLDLKKYPFLAISDNGNEYEAESIILATGAQAKWLGLKSEDKYKGFGVSACATCDGFFFRNEIIAVIGGGNTAVEEALFLTKFAKKVILIHRRDTLRAEKILQERLFNNPKVEVIWNSVLKEIIGIDNPLCVEAIKIENQKNNKEIEIACKGVFIAIGHAPSNELILNQLETHNGGYVVTKPNSTETSIPGVFAAGDITDFKYRQAVTAAGMGCMAALEAEKFLSEK
ncbi:MAG: thioredoxin-disulfide reductase [Rhodobacterales bacterium]|jgi:thioredoxin reductase (NADPH)|nr:MAG: thioredoxin-disulfide reductase [Rhodobacterales bacterium]|tara:strand:- start:355 stop:1287 length:933 start_codon:yes stop_codon:yes gene_type:complete